MTAAFAADIDVAARISGWAFQTRMVDAKCLKYVGLKKAYELGDATLDEVLGVKNWKRFKEYRHKMYDTIVGQS